MKSLYYFAELVGQKFNRLTVFGLVKRADRKMYLACRCDCGTVRTIIACAVTRGSTPSCGCLKSERLRETHTKHGHTSHAGRSPEYLSWSGMIQRCYNPNTIGWKNYGGRGITVCEHWRESFSTFLADMGPKPPRLTLDRRDNEQGYLCPRCHPPIGNCWWTTWKRQIANRRKQQFSELKSESGKRAWARRTPEQRQARIDGLRDWWMAKTPEERKQHGIAAAASRWGGKS